MDTLESVQHLVADVCRDNYKNILVKQNDQKTRYIIVRCTENGAFKHLDNRTMKCNIKILTPDKRLIYNTCAIQDDGMVMVALTEAAVRASGVAKAELNIIGIDDSSQLATMTFNLIIKPSVFDNSEITSSNEFGVLTDLIAKEKERIQIVVDLENRISEEEAEWKSNEEIRLSNEEERIASESDRTDNENQRTENENVRIENENIRIGNENLRQENETARQTSETERDNAESDRKDAESQRELNETDRISAEDKRSQDEDSRKADETLRQNAEETRTVSENERNQNEDVRKSNEVIRETNETVRDENESLRQENESSRINAETKRVADTTAAVSNANTAAEHANAAADRANTVAESYETIEFEETATRQQISSGDSIKTLLGKIKKWLSDLKPVAFSGSYNDLDDKPEINVATTEDAGIVKPDGETITVDEDGTIHGSAKVDVATSERAGVVKPDDKTTVVTEDGTLIAISAGFIGTQEEYEAANTAGEIADGTIVNLTDDYSQGPGGGDITVDNELSETSENPVQNKIITERINELDELIEQTKQLKASFQEYGMVKLSSASNITDSTGLALGTNEKNENIYGTLAYKIRQTDKKITMKTLTPDVAYSLNTPEGAGNNTFLLFGSTNGVQCVVYWITTNVGIHYGKLTSDTGNYIETKYVNSREITLKHTLASDAKIIGVTYFTANGS